jgi:hypothetical protein
MKHAETSQSVRRLCAGFPGAYWRARPARMYVVGTLRRHRSEAQTPAEDFDIERSFREARLHQAAPITTHLILSCLAGPAPGLPRSH